VFRSVTFWYGSGCGSQRPDNIRILGSGSGTLIHLHHSSKTKSHKTAEIKDFLTILLDDGRIRSQIRFCTYETDPDADPGHPKTYGSYGSRSGFATTEWNYERNLYPDLCSRRGKTNTGTVLLCLGTPFLDTEKQPDWNVQF
jgi:hypothetical protein